MRSQSCVGEEAGWNRAGGGACLSDCFGGPGQRDEQPETEREQQ
jgi:hypothetical protein